MKIDTYLEAFGPNAKMGVIDQCLRIRKHDSQSWTYIVEFYAIHVLNGAYNFHAWDFTMDYASELQLSKQQEILKEQVSLQQLAPGQFVCRERPAWWIFITSSSGVLIDNAASVTILVTDIRNLR